MRILYVEDNRELRSTISMLMEAEGRTVTSCETAEEALEIDAQSPFDVLVSDVGLPGMSGTDLARTLLAQDVQRWIILCSGYELGRYPSEWGPNVRTLLKPFDVEDLDQMLESIQRTLAGRAA